LQRLAEELETAINASTADAMEILTNVLH